MKHINLTNWLGSITDWTKLNYIYGGLDDSYAVKGNLRIDKDNYNYVEFRESKNLILFYNVEETTVNGITYKVENGVLTFNGTATVDYEYIFDIIPFIIPTSKDAGGGGVLYFGNSQQSPTPTSFMLEFLKDSTIVDTWGFLLVDRIVTSYYGMANKECNKIGLKVEAGTTLNLTVKLMFVNNGKIDMPFEPGFEGKKYVITEKLGIVDLGSLSYTYYTGSQTPVFIAVRKSDMKQESGGYCPIYEPLKDFWTIPGNDMKIWISTNNLNISNSNYNNGTTFKTAMNGVMFIYELIKPVIEVIL